MIEGLSSVQALFLGCGDPRNAIATAAEAGKDPKLKLLQLSLNDRMPAIIARAGLLLLMVRSMGYRLGMHLLKEFDSSRKVHPSSSL